MRIHIQNDPDDPLFEITPEQWQAALARAPDTGGEHDVSFGSTDAAFVEAIEAAELLIAPAACALALFPAKAPRLRAIFFTSAGLDKLAPFTWVPPGVAVLNNRGTHGEKAGEFVIMALLMLAHAMPVCIANQAARRWEKHHTPVLRGRSATVVGLGTLGGAAAVQAAAFGMQVTGVRTTPEPHPSCARVVATEALDEVLPRTEFLVLACPLTARTRGLLTRERLALLPKGAGIVNVGRGGLVDQDALCDALDHGHLGGAVLDVFTPEPVPAGHRLWTTRNLVMTPHVSADDPLTYNPRSLDIFLDNLRALRDGRALPNRFDIDRGY